MVAGRRFWIKSMTFDGQSKRNSRLFVSLSKGVMIFLIFSLYVSCGTFQNIQFNQWCSLIYSSGYTLPVLPDKCLRREGGRCCWTELYGSKFLNDN